MRYLATTIHSDKTGPEPFGGMVNFEFDPFRALAETLTKTKGLKGRLAKGEAFTITLRPFHIDRRGSEFRLPVAKQP